MALYDGLGTIVQTLRKLKYLGGRATGMLELNLLMYQQAILINAIISG